MRSSQTAKPSPRMLNLPRDPANDPDTIRLGVKATDFQGPVRTKDMARAKRKVDRATRRGTR